MAQTYPPGNRVGFRITLDDNGFVNLKGGAQYLEMLFSGMFGMSGEELASRVVRVWLLYDTVTDSVLSRLKRFPNLRELSLTSTRNLTLTGWENLSELPNLKYLNLCGLPFTDSYLDRLTILTGLEKLVISETAIAREAIERIKQSLSNVDVDYEAQVANLD